MVRACRNINVHVINTYLNDYGQHDNTNQYAQYELKIAYKTWQQKHLSNNVFFFFFFKKIHFWVSML